MTLIAKNVNSIDRQIQQLSTYHGTSESTHILITRALIAGSYAFEQINQQTKYGTGTVLAKRAEGIVLHEILRQTTKKSRDSNSRELGKIILPQETLADLMNNYKHHELGSHLLPALTKYLYEEEKRRERFINIGVQLQRRRAPAHYISSEDIDLSRLKERNTTTTQKNIFREFNNIYSTIQQVIQ